MEIKKSLHELARGKRKAMIVGIGGGGDIIQGIPIRNYLKFLGVEEVWLGGVSCQWWPFEAESPNTYILAPTIYSLQDLNPCYKLNDTAAMIYPESTVEGKRPAEAKVGEALKTQTLVFGLEKGVKGMLAGLQKAVEFLGIELVVAMDVGSDSFFSHTSEVRPPRTPLVDLLALAALYQLNLPVVYGLAGYGCDGELELEDLERNVARVMQQGGYLGAYGLTQQDVLDMEIACAAFPDPVEKWPCEAARGNLGLKNMRLMEPWGTTIRLTALAAVILLFDLKTVVEAVAIPAQRLLHTESLHQAEEIFMAQGILPETRLPRTVKYWL